MLQTASKLYIFINPCTDFLYPGLYLVQSLREQEEDNDEEQQEKNSSMNTT